MSKKLVSSFTANGFDGKTYTVKEFSRIVPMPHPVLISRTKVYEYSLDSGQEVKKLSRDTFEIVGMDTILIRA